VQKKVHVRTDVQRGNYRAGYMEESATKERGMVKEKKGIRTKKTRKRKNQNSVRHRKTGMEFEAEWRGMKVRETPVRKECHQMESGPNH